MLSGGSPLTATPPSPLIGHGRPGPPSVRSPMLSSLCSLRIWPSQPTDSCADRLCFYCRPTSQGNRRLCTQSHAQAHARGHIHIHAQAQMCAQIHNTHTHTHHTCTQMHTQTHTEKLKNAKHIHRHQNTQAHAHTPKHTCVHRQLKTNKHTHINTYTGI